MTATLKPLDASLTALKAVEHEKRRRRVLSQREFEVLCGLADGLSIRQIGKSLHIAEATVKTHIQRMRRTLGARNRSHAVSLGYERGILTAGGSSW